jgi:3-oxoacyl-[acyl-carrier protein] reductase
MPASLDGQAAIVTGAAHGVGRGVARVLAAEGARVVVADVDEAGAGTAAAALVEDGLDAVAVSTDVTDRASTERMAAAALDAYGRIDVLVANAGIYPMVRLADMDDAAWDRVMGINVKGALHAIQACMPAMLERGYGRIVLMSSVTGPITGYPGFAHYGASKAALLGMMRSIALEVARRGVTVNAVMPGNVQTEGLDDLGEEHKRKMLAAIPMGEFADPADVGWAVRFLASPEARYITGQTLVVDGGQVLPESPEALADMV